MFAVKFMQMLRGGGGGGRGRELGGGVQDVPVTSRLSPNTQACQTVRPGERVTVCASPPTVI